MKKVTLLLVSMFSYNLMSSSLLEELHKSRESWENLKKEYGPSYCRTHLSDMHLGKKVNFGQSVTTAIKVKNDVVVERSYQFSELRATPTGFHLEILDEWTEIGNDIGGHAIYNAAPPILVEEIYQECEKYLGKDPQRYSLRFTTGFNNLIRQCSYTSRDADSTDKGLILISETLFENQNLGCN